MTVPRSRAVLLLVVVLIVAMAGGATAGGLITGSKIKDGTVTGIDVRDGSLKRADLAFKPTGPQGPAGEPGPQGVPGPAGPTGPAAGGLEYRLAQIVIGANQTRTWSVTCSGAKRVVGGGVSSTLPTVARISESAPLNDGVGWGAGLHNSGPASITAYVWAVCLSV